VNEPIVTAFGTFMWEVVDRIVRFADATNLPPPLVLAMGYHESGGTLATDALNDGSRFGTTEYSVGVFQINTLAHGGPPERWQGLDGLDRSMAEMRDRWLSAFTAQGGWDAWVQDPRAFQQEWTPAAQGSIPWTPQMAGRAVGAAFVIYALYLKRLAGPAPAPAPVLAPARGCRELVDAATMQANALEQAAAALRAQAGNLRAAIVQTR